MAHPKRTLSEHEKEAIEGLILDGWENKRIEDKFRVSRQQVAAKRAWLTMRGFVLPPAVADPIETVACGREPKIVGIVSISDELELVCLIRPKQKR